MGMNMSRRAFLKFVGAILPAAAVAGAALPKGDSGTAAVWRDNSGWKHYAVTWNGRTGETKRYVDGERVPFEGSNQYISSEQMWGNFWSYALSPAEILAVATRSE